MHDILSFLSRKASEKDSCSKYKLFDKKEQRILENVYKACWRFNLNDGQTLYILNEIAKEFLK